MSWDVFVMPAGDEIPSAGNAAGIRCPHSITKENATLQLGGSYNENAVFSHPSAFMGREGSLLQVLWGPPCPGSRGGDWEEHAPRSGLDPHGQ